MTSPSHRQATIHFRHVANAEVTYLPDLRQLSGRLALLLALVTWGKVTTIAGMAGLSVNRLSLVQYGLLAGAVALLATRSRGLRLAAALLPLAALTSTLMSAQPAAALPRWGGWALIYAAGAPLFLGPFALEFRAQLWKSFMLLAVAITLLSLPLYFLPVLPRGRGFFSGLMAHSMLMAPVAGLAAAALLARYLHTQNRRWLQTFFGALAVVVLCGSRGALLASLASSVFFVLIATQAVRRKVIPVLLLLAAAGGGAYLWRGAFAETEVGHYYLVTKGTRNTRLELWETRLAEARAHPWLGVGIGMSAAAAEADLRNTWIGSREMRIEPGSSWLAMFSMTGAMGSLGFSILMLSVILPAIRRRRPEGHGAGLDEVHGCMLFLMVHASFEGYIFAVGAPMALVFWLCIGRWADLSITSARGQAA